MINRLKNLLGNRWVLAAVPLLVVSFMAFLVPSSVSAADLATWKDKATITYKGIEYKGPTKQTLNTTDDGQTGSFNVFSSGGSSILFFPAYTGAPDMSTAKQVYYSPGKYATDAIAVALTNTQASAPAAPAGTPTTLGESSEETCNLSGIGWIVCPVATFFADVTDAIYALVEQLLVFQVAENPFDGTNSVFKIWNNIKDLANVAFIIALFVVIFSQATSVGLSNYGIKKMLPRILVAAILINLSYYICVLGVDISNIIGAGIDGIVNSALAGDAGTSTDDNGWVGLIALALGGGGLLFVGATAGGALAYAALPFLVTALFAVITALVVLVGRHALLIILIILSPLAFAAYILPNTEKFFDMWRKAFMTMLIFYPLVALLFAGSQVAGSVMRLTADGGTMTDQLIKVMSLGVQMFPLFALPFLLKFSGGVLGKVAGVVNNPNKGPFDSLRKRAEQKRDTGLANRNTRLYNKPTPEFKGKTGRARKALYGALTPTGVVKGKVDREEKLAEAKKFEQNARKGYYANKAYSDPEYAKSMTPTGSKEEALLVKSGALREVLKQRGEMREAVSMNLSSRNGAMLAVEGFDIDVDGKITGKLNGRDITIPNFGRGIDAALQAELKEATGVVIDGDTGMDRSTVETLQFARSNDLTKSVEGAKALGGMLAKSGGLSAEHIKVLSNATDDPDQRSYIVDHLNEAAGSAGLKHLSYNTVAPDGAVNIGGQFGGIEGTVNRLMQNGVSTLTKEMYTDKTFSVPIATRVARLEVESPETFEAELVKMDPRKIESLVAAKVEARMVTPADKDTVIKDYVRKRAEAIERLGVA